eukprot:2740767-Karenia_brevis.AAC.1
MYYCLCFPRAPVTSTYIQTCHRVFVYRPGTACSKDAQRQMLNQMQLLVTSAICGNIFGTQKPTDVAYPRRSLSNNERVALQEVWRQTNVP